MPDEHLVTDDDDGERLDLFLAGAIPEVSRSQLTRQIGQGAVTVNDATFPPSRKLRAGEWSIQREVDLHGLRSDEAREALGAFIRAANKAGVRCVRVVHGKGLGSPGKQPVLKTKTQRWLIQKNEVLAFVQAKPAEGGAGALVVLLAPVGK